MSQICTYIDSHMNVRFEAVAAAADNAAALTVWLRMRRGIRCYYSRVMANLMAVVVLLLFVKEKQIDIQQSISVGMFL